MPQTPHDILHQYFGYTSFHPGQEECINAILSGRDALAIMPTGAGKSICYQIPAMLLPGCTVVISPLISLMQDQVRALNLAGIHAAYINSTLTDRQIQQALSRAADGQYKIMYVAPERLLSMDFLGFAAGADISMVTVDEAHCISQWGQDFRPSYLKIVDFIKGLRQRPIVSAFTATATEAVKEDILCMLNLVNPHITVTGFDRPNLFFGVEHVSRKNDFVLNYIQKHADESGIIYCATRKNTDMLFELLFKSGVPVARYHAGMQNEDRRMSQEAFVYDRARVMVATNAFGMGIDKSNVRYVLHYNMPQSMENYYQEAGRAGRDGERAECILLFSPQDVRINRVLLENKVLSDVPPEDIDNIHERDQVRLRKMENYCRTTDCLRAYILKYFTIDTDEPAAARGDGKALTENEAIPVHCGNCSNCLRTFKNEDMTEQAKWVINCLAESRGRFGVNIVTGTLLGASRGRLKEIGAIDWKSYGKLQDQTESRLKRLIQQMADEGFVMQTPGRYSVLTMGPKAMTLKDPDVRVIVSIPEEKEAADTDENSGKKHRSSRGQAGISGRKRTGFDSLTSVGYRLFEELRTLRTTLARELHLPPYIIFSDKTLIDMCIKVPTTESEMLGVSGVAQTKYERYGEQFLQVIYSFLEAHADEVTAYLPEDMGVVDTDDSNQAAGSGIGQGADSRIGQGTDYEGAGSSEAASDSGSLPAETAVTDESDVSETKKRKKSASGKKSRKKADFYITPEEAEVYVGRELCYVTEIKDQMNSLAKTEGIRKLTGTKITEYLMELGLLTEVENEIGTQRMPTQAGLDAGIELRERVSSKGITYQLPVYPTSVQEIIVKHFTHEPSPDDAAPAGE